jgi:hypothetical protein
MKKCFFFLLSLSLYTVGSLRAQDYSVISIPDSLKENASAVIRMDQKVVEAGNSGIRTKATFAITVLNHSGNDLNSFVQYYDSDKKIKSVRATAYDRFGKKIQKFSQSDFKDYSAVSGFSLYEDNRVIYFKPHINQIPYTIEYEYETHSREFLSFPRWYPVRAYNVSTLYSEYQIILPKEYKVNIREFNLPSPARITEDNKEKTITFRLENFQAIESEPHSPHIDTYLPMAMVVPQNFTLDKYPGSFESWGSFGNWVHDLIKDRNDLSEEAIEKVKAQIGDAKKDMEKIRILYNYLQSTTRYVSIQLGIGGYQPFSADYVYTNGYGDCKALTNYMKSMLEVAGIESFYALVKAGRTKEKIYEDFPNQQFNHVILCVPVAQDTLWLECTSQTNPLGYLGFFTDDRYALLIEKDNSKLVRTKSYSMQENLQNRTARVVIHPDKLALEADVHTWYSGKQYESVDDLIHESQEDQKEALLKSVDIPEFQLQEFAIEKKDSEINPSGEIHLKLEANNYLSVSGDRLFLPLNLMNKTDYVPPRLKERKNDIYFSYNYSDTDTIIYELPENYSVEYKPDNILISEPFGSYSVEVIEKDNQLLFIRKRSMKKGSYDPSLYESLINYYETVRKGDKLKALLKKVS